MNSNTNTNAKNFIVQTICQLYVLLFVYAAVSKLIDFQNFQVQVGQSPLLSAFAGWISWIVPVVELMIALALLIPKSRNSALFASLSLMSMFTVYIYIVLHYSSFVPCSCGGILEKMSWNAHLIFNIVFVLLAIWAILLQRKHFEARLMYQKWYCQIKILLCLLLSAVFIIVLFFWSEGIMRYDNPFIRRYPNHAATPLDQKDLKFNSYYFAGFTNGRLYLGNVTAPLELLSFDRTLKNPRTEKIIFDPKKIPFTRVKINIDGSYFLLKDGSVPIIFRGSTLDWKINTEFKGLPYFDLAEPIDSNTVVFRSNNGKNQDNIIGLFQRDKVQKTTYKNSLLQKQIDGIFDTDGRLLYDAQTKKMVYVYFYRNEFIIADKAGRINSRGHTIDTISKAKIKVSYLQNGTIRKMSAPPLIVNSNAAVCQNLLFIHSKIKGKYESDKLWEQAFIIDVYDLNKNAYLMSFPIYGIGKEKLKTFIVTPSYLYAIIGKDIVLYDLKPSLKKEMKSVDPYKD